VPLGFIATPEPELTILPVNDNVVRLTLKRNSYAYTPTDRAGKANKEVIFKIYNTITVVLLYYCYTIVNLLLFFIMLELLMLIILIMIMSLQSFNKIDMMS